jgi:hypothetical protein
MIKGAPLEAAEWVLKNLWVYPHSGATRGKEPTPIQLASLPDCIEEQSVAFKYHFPGYK